MAVISLRQAWAEQDLISAALQPAKRALADSIQTAGRYAVEVNRPDLVALQESLERLSQGAERAQQAEDFASVSASVKAELLRYRDKASRELVRLRADMEAAMTAVQTMTEAVATNGSTHEHRLEQEIEQLERAAAGDDFEQLRSTVNHAARAIRASCEEVRRANAFTIAQLRDEIRILHQEVERERRSQSVDPATGGWNRLKADTKIKDLIRLNQPFCVLLAGLHRLDLVDGHTAMPGWREEALRGILKRMEDAAGDDALVARWSEDVFAAIVDVPRGAIPVTPERLQELLTGCYPIEPGGTAIDVRTAAKVALVERTKGMDEGQLYPLVGQAAFAVIARF